MNSSKGMRVWFAFFAILIWSGIYLTGFSNIHWFLYIPPAGLTFAALIGICPSQIAVFKIVGSK
jgi:hypothetical protein